MSNKVYDTITKYRIKAVCKGPLHIGSSDGDGTEVLSHPVTHKPFIQASSIAGAFRECCTKSLVEKIYGGSNYEDGTNSAENGSVIIFSDGLFVDSKLKIEIRPHVKINRKTGSVDTANNSGQFFNMEYIGVGSEFEFDVYIKHSSSEDDIIPEFERELAAFKLGDIRLGAKKSNGGGVIDVLKAYRVDFNLRDKDSYNAWINEESFVFDDKYNISNRLEKEHNNKIAYHINIMAKTEGVLQVKGLSVDSFGANAPDSVSMKNAINRYIIPGSSIKGTIRSQMEKIAKYVGVTSLIDDCFGYCGEQDDEGKRGNLLFSDIEVDNSGTADIIRHRIHIDKFTGGVFNKGLFNEQNVAGKMNIEIEVLKSEHADECFALLLMAIKDLTHGNLSLGNGYNVGKGFLDISVIEITCGNEKVKWDVHNNSFTNETILESIFMKLDNLKKGDK